MSVSTLSNLKTKLSPSPARASRFLVTIDKTGFGGAEYLCHSSQLPGKTFATTEQRTYGPIEKFPYLATYNDLDLTFYVDSKTTNIHSNFIGWLNEINPMDSNDFSYKTGPDGYSTTITITQYDDVNTVIRQIKCTGAYPISMNQLDLDWSSEAFHNLTVTFAYTYWEQII